MVAMPRTSLNNYLKSYYLIGSRDRPRNQTLDIPKRNFLHLMWRLAPMGRKAYNKVLACRTTTFDSHGRIMTNSSPWTI